MYTPNNRDPNCIKQKLIELKVEIHKSAIIWGLLGTWTHLSPSKIEGTLRKKISKDKKYLKNAINHRNIFYMYKIFHLT